MKTIRSIALGLAAVLMLACLLPLAACAGRMNTGSRTTAAPNTTAAPSAKETQQRSASYWESLGTAEVLTLTVGENEYVLTADKLGELKTTAVKARNPLSDLGRNGFVAAFTGVSLPEILASVGYADAQIVSVTVTDKDGAETKIEGRSIEKAVFALAFDGRVLKDAELAALIPPAAEQGAERVAIMRVVKLTVVLAEDGAEGGE